nr:hypothetical protein [Tanacetum cinerariifolium]
RRKEMRDENNRLDHMKQDQTMLVINRFSERKKVFAKRKKTGKSRAKRLNRDGDAIKSMEDFVELEKLKMEKNGAKDVVYYESKRPKVIIFTKDTPRAYNETSMSYITYELFDKLGLMNFDLDKYERRITTDVKVDIHGYVFAMDFVIDEYEDPTYPPHDKDVDWLLKEIMNDYKEVEEGKVDFERIEIGKDEDVVILFDEPNDFFLAGASKIEDLEELSANICMMARIQKADIDSEDGPSYDSAFISEFLEASTSTVTPTNTSKLSSPPLKMAKSSKILIYFQNLEYEVTRLHALLDAKTASKRIAFTNCEDTVLSIFYDEVKQILDYLHAIFNVMQKEFPKDVQVMMNSFESMESELDETLKQNGILNDQLLEATLNHHIEKCVLMCSNLKNDNLNDEIRKLRGNLKISKRIC